MPTAHSPKTEFQLFQKPSLVILKEHHEQGWLKTSLTYALAEISNGGCTSEQLSGAKKLVNTFLNLHEADILTPQLPTRSLGQTAATEEKK